MKARRIINKDKLSWFKTKFSELKLQEKHISQHVKLEFVCSYQGFKGLKPQASALIYILQFKLVVRLLMVLFIRIFIYKVERQRARYTPRARTSTNTQPINVVTSTTGKFLKDLR